MRAIGILKQKGGVGATTLAVHLAIAAQQARYRVLVIDVDPQRSAANWFAARDAEEPPVIAATVEQLPAILNAGRRDGYEITLIDTPPHSAPATAAVARAVQLAVIPTRPSALDLAAVPTTLQLVQATRTPAVVVLNACPARAPENEESRAVLEGMGAEVWPGQLGDRTAFRRAIAQGRAVTELEPKGKAAEEVRALWHYLDRKLSR